MPGSYTIQGAPDLFDCWVYRIKADIRLLVSLYQFSDQPQGSSDSSNVSYHSISNLGHPDAYTKKLWYK